MRTPVAKLVHSRERADSHASPGDREVSGVAPGELEVVLRIAEAISSPGRRPDRGAGSAGAAERAACDEVVADRVILEDRDRETLTREPDSTDVETDRRARRDGSDGERAATVAPLPDRDLLYRGHGEVVGVSPTDLEVVLGIAKRFCQISGQQSRRGVVIR